VHNYHLLTNKVSPLRDVTLLARRVLPLLSYVAPWSVTDDDGRRQRPLKSGRTMFKRASNKEYRFDKVNQCNKQTNGRTETTVTAHSMLAYNAPCSAAR